MNEKLIFPLFIIYSISCIGTGHFGGSNLKYLFIISMMICLWYLSPIVYVSYSWWEKQ
jgi:hypothetical protein